MSNDEIVGEILFEEEEFEERSLTSSVIKIYKMWETMQMLRNITNKAVSG